MNWGHYKIKDYPQYFTDPLGPEQEVALAALGGAPLTGYGLGVVQAAGGGPGLGAGVNGNHAISLAAEAASLGAEVMVGMKNGGVEAMPHLANHEVPGLASEVDPRRANNAYNGFPNGFH